MSSQRASVPSLLTPTSWPITPCNSSYRKSDVQSWYPQEPALHISPCKQIFIYIKWNKNRCFRNRCWAPLFFVLLSGICMSSRQSYLQMCFLSLTTALSISTLIEVLLPHLTYKEKEDTTTPKKDAILVGAKDNVRDSNDSNHYSLWLEI